MACFLLLASVEFLASLLLVVNQTTSGFVASSMMSIVTGLIVWYGTDRYMRDRDSRREFEREQQEYSRQLALLRSELELLANGISSHKQLDSFEAYNRVKRLIDGQPQMPEMRNASNAKVLEGIDNDLQHIETYFYKSLNGCLEVEQLKSFACKLQHARLELLKLSYVKGGTEHGW